VDPVPPSRFRAIHPQVSPLNLTNLTGKEGGPCPRLKVESH
jgi:hypothetical protein